MTLDRDSFISYSSSRPDGTTDMHPKTTTPDQLLTWALSTEANEGYIRLAEWGNLPLRVRIGDRISDAMLALDEAMQMCEAVAEHDMQAFDLLSPLQILFRNLSDYLDRVAD
jgi:hypothetical protein